MGCQWINMPCSTNSKKVIIFLIKIVFSLFGAQTLRSPLSRLIKSAWNFSLDLRCSLCGMTSGVKRILRLFNFTRCIDAKMNDLCLDNWAVVISRVNHLWLNGLSDFCYYFHKLFPSDRWKIIQFPARIWQRVCVRVVEKLERLNNYFGFWFLGSENRAHRGVIETVAIEKSLIRVVIFWLACFQKCFIFGIFDMEARVLEGA